MDVKDGMMKNNNKVKFSENVILLDAAFLNEVVAGVRTWMESELDRALPLLDLPGWLNLLALDAGIQTDGNDIQVILVHDEANRQLKCCEPSDLSALEGMACRIPIGELSFSCVNPAGITDCGDLFVDLMSLALDSAEVKHLALVPYMRAYGDRVDEQLRKYFDEKEEGENRQAILFTLGQPAAPVNYTWDFVSFSLAGALGIKPEEL